MGKNAWVGKEAGIWGGGGGGGDGVGGRDRRWGALMGEAGAGGGV